MIAIRLSLRKNKSLVVVSQFVSLGFASGRCMATEEEEEEEEDVVGCGWGWVGAGGCKKRVAGSGSSILLFRAELILRDSLTRRVCSS